MMGDQFLSFANLMLKEEWWVFSFGTVILYSFRYPKNPLMFCFPPNFRLFERNFLGKIFYNQNFLAFLFLVAVYGLNGYAPLDDVVIASFFFCFKFAINEYDGNNDANL